MAYIVVAQRARVGRPHEFPFITANCGWLPMVAGADGEACVCDLMEPLGLTHPTSSHRLKILV